MSTEIRIQSSTADGINIGLIEAVADGATKDELNTKIDMYIEVVQRQRAKSELASAEFELARDEDRLAEMEKQYDSAVAAREIEIQNRPSGQAKGTTNANVDNIKTNLDHLKNNIADRKIGIEALKKLAA